jgi:hypothetical protein
LAFLPMTAAIIVASTFAGRASLRLGPGRILAAGMTLIAVGMVVFARVSPTGTFLGDVLLPGLLTAAGIGLAFVPGTIVAVAGVARADAGLASGLVNTARQVGGSLGLAVLATLATQRTKDVAGAAGIDAHALTTGFHRAFLVGALFALFGALTAALALGRRGREPAPAPVTADA